MFTTNEIIVVGLEWFVCLEEKPSTWEETKKLQQKNYVRIRRKKDKLNRRRNFEIKNKIKVSSVKKIDKLRLIQKTKWEN